MNDNILLNHTFACEDDMFRTENRGAATDFVSCFLGVKSDNRRPIAKGIGII